MRMARWGVVGVGLLLVIVLVPVWAAYGALALADDHGGHAVDVAAFLARSRAYAEMHRLDDGSVQGVADVPIPMAVMQFGYQPNLLRLRTGETYVLEMVAMDVTHGVSLQMGSGSLNAALMPGMVTELKVTPTQPGEYLFLCNEYCGVGHHAMSGRIVVEGPPISPDAVPHRPEAPRVSPTPAGQHGGH
ncbi:MAG: cupredoxin domain-containing protein [Chloroflexi bacterium]|nr:cupredoxin domain-containing protein [Chloroflexota bacterium]